MPSLHAIALILQVVDNLFMICYFITYCTVPDQKEVPVILFCGAKTMNFVTTITKNKRLNHLALVMFFFLLLLCRISSSKEIPPIQSFHHSRSVNTVAFSPDGQHILTGSYGAALLWDRQGNKIQIFRHSDSVNAVPFPLMDSTF